MKTLLVLGIAAIPIVLLLGAFVAVVLFVPTPDEPDYDNATLQEISDKWKEISSSRAFKAWAGIIITYLIWTILVGAGFILNFKLGCTILILGSVTTLLFGFTTIQGEEIGMKTWFGMLLYPIKPGLTFVPRFLGFDIKTVPREWHIVVLKGKIFSCQKAGKDLDTDTGDDETKRVYFNVQFSKGKTNKENDPYQDALEGTVNAVLQFRVKPNLVAAFIANVDGLSAVAQRFASEFTAHLEKLGPKYSLRDFITNLETINPAIETAMDNILSSIGIDARPNIVRVAPSQNIIDALNSIPEARGKAQAVIEEARGKKHARIEEAHGERVFLKLREFGYGEGIASAAEAAGVEPLEWIQMKIVTTIGENSDTLVFGSGGVQEIAKIAASFGLASKLGSKDNDPVNN